MTTTQTHPSFSHNFDPTRVAWGLPEFGEREWLGIDPHHPDFVVRRCGVIRTIDYTEKANAFTEPFPALSLAEVSLVGDMTDIELAKLAASGLHTPEKSDFIARLEKAEFEDSPRGVLYRYTRYIEGSVLDPKDKIHAEYVAQYAHAALGYLGSKAIGEPYLPDLLPRNCMVGQQRDKPPYKMARLFFHDTEAKIQPVSTTWQSEYVDGSGEATAPGYMYCIQEIRRAIQQVPPVSAANEQSLAGLLLSADILLNTYGY